MNDSYKIGDYVLYYNGYKRQKGRIKSLSENGAFVVYNCNDEWHNYKNYTAQLTDYKYLFIIKNREKNEK